MQHEGEPTRDPDHRNGRPERVGAGVDRSGIRELLRLTPAPRIATLEEEEAAFIDQLRTARPIS
jgi:hypothetical protein